jgi:hypothetical protein
MRRGEFRNGGHGRWFDETFSKQRSGTGILPVCSNGNYETHGQDARATIGLPRFSHRQFEAAMTRLDAERGGFSAESRMLSAGWKMRRSAGTSLRPLNIPKRGLRRLGRI